MKRIFIILSIVLLVITLGACAQRTVEEPPTDDPNNGDVVVDPDPQGETQLVTLYFMNQEYVLTGDADLDMVIPVEREVIFGEKPLEEVVVAELQKAPEDEDLTTVLENISVLSVERVDEIAYVNLSSENLSGGSMTEVGLLQQVIMTLTELENVEQVQFLVDGSKRESLMGHFLIEEPIGREDMGQ
ncbi:spore germination protein-like protein [Alkaliphilus metalliredigens QYMF]|uniref:Spore germination protein-like protein n=1 Tax=Alkaliphilus metalliredigens (strain QYMF) TaxID=293826 RepID=A6TL67_ALKMQ|nr:GerMN domain-containing protein [Alkaliphilus metalliredigens]ABR46935.1 spore germination protein-like protein [Alkaliphilus metalliredigens QYMF]